VQLHLPGYAGGSHSEIFQGSAKAALFMAFEVIHADDDVCICHCRTDFGRLTVLAVQRNLSVVGSLDAIGDDDIAQSGQGVESVGNGTLQMVHSVGPATGVQGVAIGQKRFGSQTTQQGR